MFAPKSTRSKLFSANLRQFSNQSTFTTHRLGKNVTITRFPVNTRPRAKMSTVTNASGGDTMGFPKTSDAPGEQFEPRQTATSEDYTPNPSKSIELSPARQRLVDDVGFDFKKKGRQRKPNNPPHRSSPSTAATPPSIV